MRPSLAIRSLLANRTIAEHLAAARSTPQTTVQDAAPSSSSSSSTDATVTVNAWIRTVRKQKHVSFLSLNDGSNHAGLQAVVPTSLLSAAHLSPGASVSLQGRLEHKQGGHYRRGQGGHNELELQVDSIRVLGGCDGQSYPVQPKEHSLPFLRRNAHLRGRTSTIASMLRFRSILTSACYDYFNRQGYINTTMPLITSSDCEGAGEVFTLTHGGKPFYEERPAYLSVSGQLHLEAMTVGAGVNRCWHLAPAFRAERSDTNRHLNEFWMCEAELAFTEDLEQVMAVVEGLVKHLIATLGKNDQYLEELRDALPGGFDNVSALTSNIEATWKRIPYSAAIEELKRAAAEASAGKQIFQHRPSYSGGLKSEHERWLADRYGPVFVTDYPASQKPFYMRVNAPDSGDPVGSVDDSTSDPPQRTVACFDLIVPRIGELAGGSLREERLEELQDAMATKGMKAQDYEWYLDLRRFGSVKHGGFGLGWERLISWLLGIDNVRECIPFPRGSEGSRF